MFVLFDCWYLLFADLFCLVILCCFATVYAFGLLISWLRCFASVGLMHLVDCCLCVLWALYMVGWVAYLVARVCFVTVGFVWFNCLNCLILVMFVICLVWFVVA